MKKIIKTIKAKYFLLFLVPVYAFALNTINIDIPPPTGDNKNILQILRALLSNVVLPVGAVVCVMFIIYSGFTFLTAQGKPKEIEEAKKRLLWSLIGAAILLGATAISSAVCATLKSIITTPGLCG